MADYRSAATEAANRYGIPSDIFLRQIGAESSWNPNALSGAGAQGLGQLMPGTAAELGVDPSDPLQNLDGAARYLKQQYDQFGDWGTALAAYNAGPGNVRKHGGIPPFAETQDYVAKIMGNSGGSSGADGGNALSGGTGGDSAATNELLLALMSERAAPPEPEKPKWQALNLDPAMFMSRGNFG